MRTIHKSTLPNGLRVVTIPLHDTQAVTVFVFAKVGSRYESRPVNGISHFIEHLMFKGTTKRPTTLDISKLLDGVGANYNAMTSKDWTGYYVKMNHEHTELALDVVSDMLQHSKFDPKEIERERSVIIEEIKMYDENPLMSIEDAFESVVFGDHHPLGWNIAGPQSVIRRVSRQRIIQYRDQFYHAGNMWVVVAGKLHPDINQHIAKYFRTVRRRPRTPKYKPYRVAPQQTVSLQFKELEQVQLGLGTRAFSYTDKRLATLQVLSTILGGNMSARLFIQVRERRGLTYDVSASINPYEDSGVFMVHAGLDKHKLNEAIAAIIQELRRLKTTKVSSTELHRAKEFLRGKTILSLEDSSSLAGWYGRQSLFSKKMLSPEESLAKIARVTAADIQAVAKQLFKPANLRLALIGPYKDPKPFAKLLRTV